MASTKWWSCFLGRLSGENLQPQTSGAEQLKALIQPASSVSKMHTLKRVSIVEDWLLCVSLQSQLSDFLSSSELHTMHSIYLASTSHHLMPHLPAIILLSQLRKWNRDSGTSGNHLVLWNLSKAGMQIPQNLALDANIVTRLQKQSLGQYSSSLYSAFRGIQRKHLSRVVCGNYELLNIWIWNGGSQRLWKPC